MNPQLRVLAYDRQRQGRSYLKQAPWVPFKRLERTLDLGLVQRLHLKQISEIVASQLLTQR